MSLLAIHCFLLFFFCMSCTYCDRTPVVFEEDRQARQDFDPSIMTSGLYSAQYTQHSYSNAPYPSLRSLDRLLRTMSVTTKLRMVPASTSWKFFWTTWEGRSSKLSADAKSMVLNYMYTNSTGLIPTITNLFRDQETFPPLNKSNGWQFPIQPVMMQTGNGTFGFPGPHEDISSASVLGNDTYGRSTGQCSTSNAVRSDSHYKQMWRGSCMGAISPISDDVTCWNNRIQCLRPSCTENCCPRPDVYNPNATCAYPQIDPRKLNRETTFMDLLNNASSWSLEPPKGTGKPLQKAFIIHKDFLADAESEYRNQYYHSSDSVKALLDEILLGEDLSMASKPNSLDLALVCATVLAAVLAIDSVRIYKYLLQMCSKFMKERWQSRVTTLVGFLAVIIASSPSIITVSVIVIQELPLWLLKDYSGSGWQAKVIWETADGEYIWWIRRVLLEMQVDIGHRVRPFYILLPMGITILDVCTELYRVLRCRKKVWESLHGMA